MKLRSVTTIILLSVFGLITYAQQMAPLPIDPQVKYGKLENGLTYYIRHNAFPKNRAEFYIAQNVGSTAKEVLLIFWNTWLLTEVKIFRANRC